ncbi:MAG: energy-coupling factor transporter transmembrane protein EcfT [Methanobrevibacter sp.]|jgi:energy-coupling factor transport system permease protein|nr:energy-coupling factor transporter transmembrane protein EcfT [Methanobrevibacter sp.]
MRITKLHPITYILYYVILTVFAFLFTNPYYSLSLGIFIIILIKIQGIPKGFKVAVKGFMIMGISITIINSLISYKGDTKLLHLFGNNFMTFEAIMYGIVVAFSLILMFLVFSSFNQVVSYQELLYIFSKKFPVVSLIMIMALRFVPMLSTRLEEIIKLQSFENKHLKKGFVNKIKGLANSLVTMISWALEESMITAKSMKSRGYKTAKRTSYLSYKINRIDIIFISFTIMSSILSILGLIYGNARIEFYPRIGFSFSQFPLDIYYCSFLLLLLPLIYLESKEEMVWHKIATKNHNS